MPDHFLMLQAIALKGGNSLVIFDKHASRKCKFGNKNAVPRAVACSPSVRARLRLRRTSGGRRRPISRLTY